jgi:hypothetical protein
MQDPTDQAEALIPIETVSNDSNVDPTVTLRRKAAKRTLPFDLTEEELNLMTPPQAEDNPARKKPRLEEPLPTTTVQATRENASPDVSEGLNPPTADNDDANADLLTDTQPNAGGATPATGSWTLEEDAKLINAVANTSKKKRGKEYTLKDAIQTQGDKSWIEISALVPGRTRISVLSQMARLLASDHRRDEWTQG